MTNQTCKVCGMEMKFVKAGISKSTGKPYDGFWACPERCKQPKPNNYSSQVVSQKQNQYGQNETDKRIKWLNALNNATMLMCYGKIEKEKFRITAEWIYAMEPVENKPVDIPTINIEEEMPSVIF